MRVIRSRPDTVEQRLIAGVRAGDAAAFESIFRTYAPKLGAFAGRFIGSSEIGAELVQDVFLRVWRDRAAWDVQGTLKAYLFSAVRNRALDYLKHATVESRWAEQARRDEVVASVPVQLAPDSAAMEDLSVALNRALDGLPERRRLAFLLRFKEGMSYAEIAQLMGTTTKTVENQIARALRMLRARLGPTPA
jgi:RNA polymerase sigma-70 factor (ECF subfamily)